jgi:ABC-type Mn2+/Zn2+ transport system ATPase subunit
MLLTLNNTTFGYRPRAVVRIGSLELAEGGCLGIYGSNGSGKSTLLKGLAGVIAPLAGTLERRAGLRPAYVPQRQTIDPHWPMTAFDAACLATSATSMMGWLGGRKSKVLAALERLRVADLAPRPFATLSGGQQQRILLAGALAADPHLLFLDEPTDGLDAQATIDFLGILREEISRGLAIVLISHEISELRFIARQIAWVRPRTSDAAGEPSRVDLLDSDRFVEQVISAPASAGGGR